MLACQSRLGKQYLSVNFPNQHELLVRSAFKAASPVTPETVLRNMQHLKVSLHITHRHFTKKKEGKTASSLLYISKKTANLNPSFTDELVLVLKVERRATGKQSKDCKLT